MGCHERKLEWEWDAPDLGDIAKHQFKDLQCIHVIFLSLYFWKETPKLRKVFLFWHHNSQFSKIGSG